MPVITLISDWAPQDYYLGMVKGKIISAAKNVSIVDIAHGLPSFGSIWASFILKSAYRNFPSGTVHLLMVDAVPDEDSCLVAIKSHKQWFISNNNGSLSFLSKEDTEAIYFLDFQDNTLESFPELHLMVPAALEILEYGEPRRNIAEPIKFLRRPEFMPSLNAGKMEGHVIFISSYGNLITNISYDFFYTNIRDKKFTIYIGSSHFKIESISLRHTEQPVGEFFAIFNSLGLLEVGIFHGNAAEMFSLKITSVIRIIFEQ